jgi:hypothetical protein
MPRILLLNIFVLLLFNGRSQTDSLSAPKSRKVIVAAGVGSLASGSLLYLSSQWYQQYNTGKFHYFNDNREWLQVDKAGHMYTAYQGTRLLKDLYRFAGYSPVKSRIFSAGTIFSYLTAIEVMDGFSEGWGFSWGDESANLAGVAIALSQDALWNEQRFLLKYSYAESGLAKYNPSLLGKDLPGKILKDYNAQTYWLSFHPLPNRSPFPSWLNLAVGYGAYGMLGGHGNVIQAYNEDGQVLKYQRFRQLMLSLDINFSKIPCRSKFLKAVFNTLNLFKMPAPGLMYSKNGVQFIFI